MQTLIDNHYNIKIYNIYKQIDACSWGCLY